MTQTPRLFSQLKLGPRTARNRIWMTAHATLLVKDHLFTDAHIAYYVERAKGGAGVITMEAMAAHPTTQPYKGKAFAFDRRMVDQYKKLADAVHAHDTLLLAQPWHRGRQTNSVTNGLPVWAPSAIPCAVYREMPHVMTDDDIAEIIDGYRLSARYAREGGLDGVEMHGMAHGYLLGQFLSPGTNHRDDRWGGSLENRLRIVFDILKATREECGPGMIVGVRMNSDDGMEGGLGPDEWAEIARLIEATGLVDYVSCSQGTYLNRMLIYPTSPEIHGYQLPATRIVKRAIGLPVVGVGRITQPEEAEAFLAEGALDFVGLTRALIADPAWGVKAQAGRSADIRPCVGANWCMETIFAQASIACIHNPAAGAERTLSDDTLQRATAMRRIAVVGAGPAGLQAAATLARRGHDVTLFEARAAIGGQVAWWVGSEIRRELGGILTHLERRARMAGVTIITDRRMGPDDFTGYDEIVVATGSTPLAHGWTPLRPAAWGGPSLPGADRPNVLTLADVLGDHSKPIADTVTLYDAMGGRQAAVVADHLAVTLKKSVRFVTTLGQALPNLAASRDWGKVYGRLKRAGVRFTTDREITAIGDGHTIERDLYTKENFTESAGSVVLILGSCAEDGLFHALKRAGRSAHLIGDAMAPRRVSDAIREGEELARRL